MTLLDTPADDHREPQDPALELLRQMANAPPIKGTAPGVVRMTQQALARWEDEMHRRMIESLYAREGLGRPPR